MAFFQTQTTSSLQDLLTKLDTFLTTAGAGNPAWTAENVDGGGNSLDTATGRWAISKSNSDDSCEVAFQWDTASPNALGVYQYLSGSGPGNYNNANAPWAQTDDSGNGAASSSDATLLTSRHVPIGNSPLQYWAFTGDTASSEVYAHIVVETSLDVFVHFGFGIANKFNDWTGGAYAYGYRVNNSSNNAVAVNVESTLLLDGLCNGVAPGPDMQFHGATMHIEGMTDSPVGGKWGVCMGNQSPSSFGQDRQTVPVDRIHVMGGCRGGPSATTFGQFLGTLSQGLVPGYPMVQWHFDRDISTTSAQPGSVACISQMRDVRGISIANFQARDQITIGSDTWHVFPSGKRWPDTGSLNNTTGYQGLMYKEN